jgi:hypothetical protein
VKISENWHVSARARAACSIAGKALRATPRALPLTKNTQLHTSDRLQPPQMPPKRAASNLSPGTVSSPSSSSAGTVSSATKELQNAALREGFAEYQATIRKHKESRTKIAVISMRQFCADLIAEDDRLQPLNAESLRARFKRIINGKSLEEKLAPSLDPVVPMGRPRIGMDPLQKLGFIQHTLAAFNASIKQ